MTNATKNGKAVRLFTQTTDEMVALDLACPPYGSLIATARISASVKRLPEHDHFDLAWGAFFVHMRYSKNYTTLDISISRVDAVPDSKHINSVGGEVVSSGNNFICNIWEEPDKA